MHDLFHFLIQTDVLVVHSTDVLASSQAAHHILLPFEQVVWLRKVRLDLIELVTHGLRREPVPESQLAGVST